MQITKTAIVLSLTAAAFVTGRATGVAATQEEGMTMEAKEAAWDAMGKTGKMHELLKPFEGTWNANATFHMPTGTMESTGTMVNSWILGGKILEQRYEGDFQGETFQGVGLWAYSNVEEAYQTIWIDNMSTHIDFNQSMEVSDDGKLFTATGTHKMGGMAMKYKDVVTLVSESEHTFVRTMMGEAGEHESMRIVYTR